MVVDFVLLKTWALMHPGGSESYCKPPVNAFVRLHCSLTVFIYKSMTTITWWSLKFEKKIILRKVGTHCRRFFCLRLSELYSRSVVSDSAPPLTEAYHASLVFTIFRSLLKLMSIESVMPSNHLILCHPLLLPSIFPSIRVFSEALNQVPGPTLADGSA